MDVPQMASLWHSDPWFMMMNDTTSAVTLCSIYLPGMVLLVLLLWNQTVGFFFFFFFLLNVPLVLGLTWLATSRLFQHWSLDIFFTIFLFNSHKIRYNLSNNILFFSLLSISLGQTKEYSISFLHHYLKKSNNIPTCCLVFQSLSCVWLVATPWTAACQASLPFTVSHCLFKFMSIELVMPSNHLMPCHPLLLLPSVFPSMRIFSNVSPLHQVTKVLELQL